MFDCITKRLKVRQEYSIVCYTFDSLLMFGNMVIDSLLCLMYWIICMLDSSIKVCLTVGVFRKECCHMSNLSCGKKQKQFLIKFPNFLLCLICRFIITSPVIVIINLINIQCSNAVCTVEWLYYSLVVSKLILNKDNYWVKLIKVLVIPLLTAVLTVILIWNK